MVQTHNLGFPRIGAGRELKWALEGYWHGKIDAAGLARCARELRLRHWRLQAQAGTDWVPVGDFSLYDHVLDTSALLGVVPERFGPQGDTVDLDAYFRMARGRAPGGADVAACEMTKWFDTNYHYIVPEFAADQQFRIASTRLFEEAAEALAAGFRVKPVLIGPLTYLWLGKAQAGEIDRLALLERLIPVYREILQRLAGHGIEWVQIDEPILALDLPSAWLNAFESTYHRLKGPVKLLLATYFGALEENTGAAVSLPVEGLHVDLVSAPRQLDVVLDRLGPCKTLSLGVVDGRNVWRTDLDAALGVLAPAAAALGERLWLAPSCSLLHCPLDLGLEQGLGDDLGAWLAFARQKLEELSALKAALNGEAEAVAEVFAASARAAAERRRSPRTRRPAVRRRLAALGPADAERPARYERRAAAQQARLRLPLFPTTTIGSFPQTADIRQARRARRSGELGRAEYLRRMRGAVDETIARQEALGLDVLVHGEPERNDMVEHFAGLLDGFAVSAHGWVQSFGSRCVKPPIVFGDVTRPGPMTVQWARYAQSLTERPVKGMLTGPVTMLQWSFVRDDQPRADTCLQIALALRDEVDDLERAGIAVVQIDEPALREGLPLRRRAWQGYLDWAVRAFRVTAGAAGEATQIHTHMCYAEFNDIIEAIAALDADVITLETSRSRMELLDAFRGYDYPRQIGPGVFDIHSPRIVGVEEMADLLRAALRRIPAERLWVNPDCGLKTREWSEVEPNLTNMVEAARRLRAELAPAAGEGSPEAGAA